MVSSPKLLRIVHTIILWGGSNRQKIWPALIYICIYIRPDHQIENFVRPFGEFRKSGFKVRWIQYCKPLFSNTLRYFAFFPLNSGAESEKHGNNIRTFNVLFWSLWNKVDVCRGRFGLSEYCSRRHPMLAQSVIQGIKVDNFGALETCYFYTYEPITKDCYFWESTM